MLSKVSQFLGSVKSQNPRREVKSPGGVYPTFIPQLSCAAITACWYTSLINLYRGDVKWVLWDLLWLTVMCVDRYFRHLSVSLLQLLQSAGAECFKCQWQLCQRLVNVHLSLICLSIIDSLFRLRSWVVSSFPSQRTAFGETEAR